MATKRQAAMAEAMLTVTDDDMVTPSPWQPTPRDLELARVQQQQQGLLLTYVDFALKAETLIGAAEASARVRDGLDRLKAIVDALAEA